MAGRRIERDEEKHGYVWRRDILILFLVIGLSLSVIAYAQFYAPTVKVSTETTELTGGTGGGTAAIAAGTNESEEPKIHNSAWLWNEIPEGPEWQEFVDETRVEWIYNSAGEKVGGTVFTGKEPLRRNFEICNATGYIDYLENWRNGGCAYSFIAYRLFEAKGEKVKMVKARSVNYNPEYIGSVHGWVEWTDKAGEKFVIDHGKVWTAEDWSRFNWTERKVWTAEGWETT